MPINDLFKGLRRVSSTVEGAWLKAVETGRNKGREAEVHIAAGIEYQRAGQYRAALEQYTLALEFNPSAPGVLHNRGAVLNELGRKQEALADFERSLQLRRHLEPDHPDTLQYSAWVHQFDGQYEEALADYNRSLQLKAGNIDALLGRARVLRLLGYYDDALRDLDEVGNRRLSPASAAMLHQLRALTLCDLDRADEAYSDFAASAQLDPEDANNYLLWADALRVGGRTGEALEKLNKALVLSPGSPSIFAARGVWRADLGQYEDAAADFLRLPGEYVADNPHLLPVIRLAFMQTGRSEADVATYVEAIERRTRNTATG